MPRNYSIKDTIQQVKDGIHNKKIKKIQDDAEPKMTPTFPYRDYESKDTIIKFNQKQKEEENKPSGKKKWYQFWK